VLDAAYGGTSLLGNGWHAPGECQLPRRMIPILFRGNPN
jgi:hypothetical protein